MDKVKIIIIFLCIFLSATFASAKSLNSVLQPATRLNADRNYTAQTTTQQPDDDDDEDDEDEDDEDEDEDEDED